MKGIFRSVMIMAAASYTFSIGANMESYRKDFKCFDGYPKLADKGIEQVEVTDNLPVWNLGFVYSGTNDPKIMKDIESSIKRARSFRKKYEQSINKQRLSAAELLKAIRDYEDILQKAILPEQYISNVSNTDMNNNEVTALLGKIQLMTAQIMKDLTFFENGLSRSTDAYKKKVFSDKKLTTYANWLKKISTRKKYLLPEDQEQLLIDKDINGASAWAKFRRIYESKYTFNFKGPKDSSERPYTLTELVKFVEEEDREVRQSAAALFLKKFNEDSYIFAQIYNSIIQDMILIEKNRRGYSPLITVRNRSSQLDDKVVETMHQVITDNYALAQRYWKLKARLLKISAFNNADVRAPYIVEDNSKYSYTQAMELLQQVYDDFYKPFGAGFENMYRCGLVHAVVKPGKRGGAYCDYFGSGYSPIVLINYQGTIEDVSTIAHEGGHWMHGLLMAQDQTLLNTEIPMVTAETASVFNEILLTSRLLKDNAGKKKETLAILVNKLDGIMATVFRQTAFSKFEQAAFKASEGGPLTPEQFSEIFVNEYGALFGDAVQMMPDFKYEWARIPHFMRPFYVYAYAFGELATISLYEKYLEDPKNFPKGYMEFLAAGSSLSPQELFMKTGVDLRKKDTWEGGFRYIGSLIDQMEGLVNEL